MRCRHPYFDNTPPSLPMGHCFRENLGKMRVFWAEWLSRGAVLMAALSALIWTFPVRQSGRSLCCFGGMRQMRSARCNRGNAMRRPQAGRQKGVDFAWNPTGARRGARSMGCPAKATARRGLRKVRECVFRTSFRCAPSSICGMLPVPLRFPRGFAVLEGASPCGGGATGNGCAATF